MDKNSVLVNNYYHLRFKPEWADLDGDYKIIGYSSPDVVTELDSQSSLFKTYFQNYGFDIEKYNQYVVPETLVYVAVNVTSKDPIAENPVSKRVFIPSTLIRFDISFVYISAKRFDYTVSTGEKLFASQLEEDTWTKKILTDISNAIIGISDFSSDTVSVDSKSIDVLTTQTVIDTLKEKREAKAAEKYAIIKQARDNQEVTSRTLELKISETEKEKASYVTKAEELDGSIVRVQEVYSANTAQSERLERVKQTMIEMLRRLISGESTIDTSSSAQEQFDKMYEEAGRAIS